MSFTRFRERSRDVQDGLERHVWGEKEYISGAGAIAKVRGTDTKDEEAEVVNLISGFKMKKDFNTEVFLLASSSDTMLKQALETIPKDKQRRWMEEHGGIQFPLDPEFALDFRKDLAHVTKHFFAVGKEGEFEVREKNIYCRLDGKKFIIDGELIVNKLIKTPMIVSGKEPPPGFQGNEQEPEKKKSGGGQQQASASQLDMFNPQLEFGF